MEVTEINIADAERIVKRCPLLADIERIEVLARGFSAEQKFILWQRGEPAYVLRTSSVEQCRQRELGFDLLRAHYSSGVRCSQPFYFGKDETIGLCHVLVGYILGRAASDALPELSAQSQYEIGVEAGRELLKLHRMCHPDLHFNWFDRRLAKYERKVAQDAKHGLTFKHQNEIKRYIESNIDLLRESPVRFQHDDFHPANLIVRDGKLQGIIDFNRCDWGDPVEDFYKIPWFTAQVSIPFAQGQVEGYFTDGVPERFWDRYNLLVALNIPGSLAYAHKEGMDWWPERLDMIIDDHDFTGNRPPGWFAG